jgi:hypothetical protein
LELTEKDLAKFGELTSQGNALQAFSKAFGDKTLGNGFWRFYSDSWPAEGISNWNTDSPWMKEWNSLLQSGILYFGEDVFGNQICSNLEMTNTFIWNHEDGQLIELLVSPVELLQTAISHGLGWIDFYAGGYFASAESHLPGLNSDTHLHWTHPLIFGGQPIPQNVTLLPRLSHLIGHAKLVRQC